MQDQMTPPPMQNNQQASPLISDGTMENFGSVVMEASQQVPVLVDFWADWCAPCKQLMPMLEKLVTEAAGAVKLVKVNADENKEICGQLRIQSLPTVMAFYQGQPIDGFQGAVPESQLKEFIQSVITKAGVAPTEDSMEARIAQALEQVEAIIENGAVDQAMAMLAQILGADPENTKAKIILAECAFASGDAQQASQVLASLQDTALKDNPELKARVEKLKTQIELMAQTEGLDDKTNLVAAIEKDPMNFQARFDLSLIYVAEGDHPAAAEELLRIMMRDMEWNDQQARKQLVKLFDAAGPADPFTLKYRRRLSSILFS